jgi:ADP-ribose pyrophosphatase
LRAPEKSGKKGVQILSSEVKFAGRRINVKRDEVIEPSGIRAVREWVEHPGSVVVMPVFPDGRIVLIRQYRYAAGEEMWELVAGHNEPNENLTTGAHRELLEETGYTAKKMTKMFDFFPSPGLLGELMTVFRAEGLTKGKARPEDDEKIVTKTVTLKQALNWIRAGKIRDGKTISGVLFHAQFGEKKKK